MKHLNELLREGDPAAGDPGMSTQEIAAMRRLVGAAANPESVFAAAWQRPLAVGAMVALTLAAGVIAGQRMSPSETVSPEPVFRPDGGRRQLQFATPGGTRLIWVFDPEFDLKETTP